MKKAQIQMMETVFVLLIFLVFVGFGLIFFFNYSSKNIKQKTHELATLDAIKIALLAQNAPEFVCTSKMYIDTTCFEKEKLVAFQSLLLLPNSYMNTFYFDLFGYSKITVTKIYPKPQPGFSPERFELYKRVKPNWKSNSSFLMPVGLYDSVRDKVELGVLQVEVYS